MGSALKDQDLGGLSQQGIDDAALQSQIDTLNTLIGTNSGNNTLDPEPCTPNFILGYQKTKRRLRAQMCVNVQPGVVNRIKVVVCPQNMRHNSTEFNQNIISDTYTLDDTQITAGHVEFLFPPALEYSTTYDLVRIISIGDNGRRSIPSVDPVFSSTPILSFTTPDQLGSPSAPSSADIIYNERDFLTADQHDAHLGLRVWAPLDAGGNGQSYAAAGVDWVRTHLTRDYGGTTGVISEDSGPHLLDATELTQVATDGSGHTNRGFVVLEQKGLVAGGTYVWAANTVHTIDGKVTNSSATVNIIAGNEQGDLNQLTNVAISVVATDPFDGKHVQPRLEFTQPATPVALKNYTLKSKLNAAADWNVVVRRDDSIQADAYHLTLNAGTITGTTASTTITGSGTNFTRLEAGWKIKVGAQTLTISNTPTSDTSLTVTANPSSNFTAQPYTIVCVVPLVAAMKTKPNNSYNLEVLIRARSSTTTPRSVTFNFSTGPDGNVVADTAAPSGLSAITFVKVKKNGTHVRFPLPATNIATLQYNSLVIGDTATGPANGVKVLTAADMSTLTTLTSAVDTAGRIDSGIKKTTVELDKSQLVALFGSVTIYFWYYSTNSVGTSTISPIFGYNLATGEASGLSNDANAPSGLAAPSADWTAAGRLRVRGMTASTDITTLKKKYLVIADTPPGSQTGSTKYLDIVNRTLITGVSNEASARFEFGVKSHLVLTDIKRKVYDTVFGSGGSFLAYWYAENSIGVSSASAASSPAITVASLNDVLSDSRDAVNVVDIGVTLTGYQNMVLNGDFLYDSGVANETNAWLRGTIGGTTNPINNVSADVNWDTGEHALVWTAVTEVFQNLKKRLQRSDYYSVTLVAKVIGGGTFSTGTVNINLVNDDDTIATIAGGGFNANLLTSSYQLFGVTVQTNSTSDFSLNKFIRISLSGVTLDATHKIQFDKIMLTRGKQGVAFIPRAALYEGGSTAPGSQENHSVTPTSTANPADLYQPSGATRGGWVSPGSGGRILPDTLVVS